MIDVNTEVENILYESGALQTGHFKLSSGFHSEKYVQCAKLFMNTNYSSRLCEILADKVKEKNIDIDLIISPAMGGILVGYELSRHLGVNNMFCERVNGSFELRRGFYIEKGAKILVVEDVVTTGKSSEETFSLIESFGGIIVAEASIINRSGKKYVGTREDIELISLLDLNIPIYSEDNLPEHLKLIPVVKPGSRHII